ncbi:MAG: hypothetical protein K0Q87_4534 [Neobacillus sp.]|jgi:hypothetical protein|nr:hypothetical protein [Neobacillus sp.]
MLPLTILKNRLSDQFTLFAQTEGGELSEAGFEFREPASIEEIQAFERENDILLPKEYKEFLLINNGSVMFKDIKYGQWGCKILGLQEILPATNELRKYGTDIGKSFIVFATWLGDGDVLLFDLDKYQTKGKNYIIDGDQGYGVEEWESLKGDFAKWLDRLIVSQGSKYWRW